MSDESTPSSDLGSSRHWGATPATAAVSCGSGGCSTLSAMDSETTTRVCRLATSYVMAMDQYSQLARTWPLTADRRGDFAEQIRELWRDCVVARDALFTEVHTAARDAAGGGDETDVHDDYV